LNDTLAAAPYDRGWTPQERFHFHFFIPTNLGIQRLSADDTGPTLSRDDGEQLMRSAFPSVFATPR